MIIIAIAVILQLTKLQPNVEKYGYCGVKL